MKQSRSTWQRHERQVAAALGTTRSGTAGTPGADVLTEQWAIECKSWRRLPVRVVGALAQAERSATAGRTPAAVLHQVGARHDADLVVMRWKDFADLLIGAHEGDRRLAARIGAIVHLADATPEETAILAPDAVIE